MRPASLPTLAALLALACPALALAGPSDRLVLGASLGGGGEVGIHGKPGLAEGELLLGHDLFTSASGDGFALRPEVAAALGPSPRFHFALRPGLRVALPATPIWLRAAFDWSNARGDATWRWLLVGAAWEVRLTGLFGLFAEVDTGIPVTPSAGLPLLVRVGATFRP